MAAAEVLLALSVIVALVYYWCKYNYSYWQRKGIQFIKPVPFLGNTKDVFTMKDSLSLYTSTMYNDPSVADAPVIGMYSLHKPCLIIRDPELVKSVLIKDFNKFSNRTSNSDPHNDPLAANNLFFVRNPMWKDIRNKVTPVFTSGKIKQMYPLMLEIGEDLEKYLEKQPKTNNAYITEVKEICALFTTDLIASIAFGLNAKSLENPNVEFRRYGREIFDFTLRRALNFFIAFFFPSLVSLFRVRILGEEFSNFMRQTIKHVMAERVRTGKIRHDLIEVLVALKKQGDTEDSNDPYSKNDDFLVAQAAIFLVAGFETSSSTMAFTLFELSKHPDIQQRLRNEICDTLVEENGNISYEKINSMEYLGMVIDEVLRLYPVLPFLDREYKSVKGEEEFTLKPHYNYTLPDGIPVFIPVYGLQRDPKYWTNPNEFDPERFSSENKKLHTSMTYLPFGNGPHNCIGSRIGILQTKIGLISFLKNHYVETCDKTLSEMKFDPKGIILQADGGIYLKIVNDSMYKNKIK